MKKVIVLILVAVAGVLVFQKIAKGRAGSSGHSPEQQIIRSFDDRIDAAGRQIAQASRSSSLSGLDTSSGVESALRDLERLESEIQALKGKTTSEEIRLECDRLMKKVEATKR